MVAFLLTLLLYIPIYFVNCNFISVGGGAIFQHSFSAYTYLRLSPALQGLGIHLQL